jgi:hypothetical protein
VQIPKPLPSKVTASPVPGTPTIPPTPPEVPAQFAVLFQLEEDEATQNLLAADVVFETHNKKETHSVRINDLMISDCCSYFAEKSLTSSRNAQTQ